ncbi:acyltransferase family protein [Pseudomonas azotoformans]
MSVSKSKPFVHPAYRPDIDGLRALAVLSVVFYHAFPEVLTGGFTGVDVFFVISGYLISIIIFKNLDADKFSLLDFYARRVRRIFPALLIMIAATFLFGWFFLLSEDLKLLGKHAVSGFAFVQNIALYRESGYFDVSSEMKPLLHLWSLGVEEQFYLIFPIAMLFLWRRKRFVLSSIVGLIVVSFFSSLYAVKINPAAAFYMPNFRAWEILAGSLLGYFSVFRSEFVQRKNGWLKKVQDPSARMSEVCAWVGLGILICSIVFINKSYTFPGKIAALPVAGALLLIYFGPGTWLVRYVLSNRAMVAIGLISYPLYLWHWPVLSMLKIYNGEPLSAKARFMAVVVSVILAWATYYYVEKRFRSGLTNYRSVIAVGLVAMVMVSLSLFVYSRQGFPFRFEERERFAAQYENSVPGWAYFKRETIFEKYRFQCDFFDVERYRTGNMTMSPVDSIAEECFTPASDRKVLIWGDSHAQQLYYGLRKSLPESVSILQVTSSGCAADDPSIKSSGKPYCDKSNSFALDVLKNTKPDLVVIAQHSLHDVSNDLTQLAKKAISLGAQKVLIVGPVPRFDPYLYRTMVSVDKWGNAPTRISSTLVSEPFETDRKLKQRYSTGVPHVDYLSAIDVFCNSDGCLTYLGSDLRSGVVSFDYGHLTPKASIYFAKQALAPEVLRLIERD